MPWNLQQTVVAANGQLVPSTVMSAPGKIYALRFDDEGNIVAPFIDVIWHNDLQPIGADPIYRTELTIYLSGQSWTNTVVTSQVWEMFLYFRERGSLNGKDIEIWKFT